MKRSSKTLIASTLLTLSAAPALHAAEAAAPTPPAFQLQPAESYLGVSIAPVPQAVRVQLGAQIPPAQGILVRQVIPGSPAAKAGLKPFDILLAFDDQKIYSPDQLIKLVRSSNNGQKVVLQVVRNSAITPVEVVVGEQKIATAPALQPRIQPLQRPAHGRRRISPHPMQPMQPKATSWEAFNAISLVKQEDGRYKAAIEYLTNQGKNKRMEFEGTRAEIRDQILRQNDLPEIERNQLLNVLTGRNDVFIPAFPVPEGFMMPRMFDWNPGY